MADRCDCQSSNRPDVGVTPAVVTNPLRFGLPASGPVSVDACIVSAIEALWRAGVRTGGSCCGHNGTFLGPSVILLNASDVPEAERVLRSADSRAWLISAWSRTTDREDG